MIYNKIKGLEANKMARDYYFAEVGEVKENGLFDEYWGFKVSKERIDTFSIESALRLLDFTNQKFTEIIGRTARFNYIKLEMDNKKYGRYWADKNLLRLYENGMPVYENNNGVITNDSVALADSLM